MSYDERRDEVHKVARDLFAQARGNPEKLATLAAQFKLAAAGRTGGTLEVIGLVSTSTGAPLVQMTWGEQQGQIDAEAARAHALLVLEAAQNAITDAAIYEWARTKLELDDERAAVLIDALRTYRSDRWGQPDLELEFSKPPPEEPE